jgi:hypothetical protein
LTTLAAILRRLRMTFHWWVEALILANQDADTNVDRVSQLKPSVLSDLLLGLTS